MITKTPDGNPVALITGCSGGIGCAVATTLAAAGYSVVATAREPTRTDAASALSAIGASMIAPLDVTDDAQVASTVAAVMERFGRLDILVNNAGFGLRGAIEELRVDDVHRLFDVNVYGIIRMVSRVAPIMRKAGRGRIVTIGSIGGRLATPANGAYAATKHALEALCDALRWELGQFGIEAILIEPGNIGTNFMAASLRESRALADSASPYANLYASFLSTSASLRAREPGPDIVARVVLQALKARRPRARYRVALPLSVRIAIALPDRVRDLIMRRMYGLSPAR